MSVIDRRGRRRWFVGIVLPAQRICNRGARREAPCDVHLSPQNPQVRLSARLQAICVGESRGRYLIVGPNRHGINDFRL